MLPFINWRHAELGVWVSIDITHRMRDVLCMDKRADEARTFYQQQGKPLFPFIGARCINSLVCLNSTTPNSEFIVDRIKPKSRIIVCSPCSGHVFKHSAAIGEAVSQLGVDGQSKIDLSALTFARISAVSS